jgi:hypothetical protein
MKNDKSVSFFWFLFFQQNSGFYFFQKNSGFHFFQKFTGLSIDFSGFCFFSKFSKKNKLNQLVFGELTKPVRTSFVDFCKNQPIFIDIV